MSTNADSVELLVGSDFGGPAGAGNQAKKIIVLEARRLGPQTYEILPTGRNERLVRAFDRRQSWQLNRRGWTGHSLAASLCADPLLRVGAFDYPFSIPLALLQSTPFAQAVGAAPFTTRAAWQTFVKERLPLSFATERAGARLDFAPFEQWKNQAYWLRRATDIATGGQPPLKHVYQVLFGMTLLGASLLADLSAAGINAVLNPALPLPNGGHVIETYPGKVAEAIGFEGNYKAEPTDCLAAAQHYLAEQAILLHFDRGVRQFCLEYRTSGVDPDGADAFLCLVAAICFREGLAIGCIGSATDAVLQEEG